jgi:hypothetical protein
MNSKRMNQYIRLHHNINLALEKSLLRNGKGNQLWQYTPVITATWELRQEECEFKPSLGIIVRPHQRRRKRNPGREGERDGGMEGRKKEKAKHSLRENSCKPCIY